MPDIFVILEALWRILRAQYPCVIRQATAGGGALVGIDELARRGNEDGVAVEGEIAGILDEMKEMGVAAAEFRFAIHAEGVIPDDPTAADQIEFALENELEFG